jgi:hypothetical protein
MERGGKARVGKRSIHRARTEAIFRSVIRARQGNWHLRKSRTLVIDIRLAHFPADGGSHHRGENSSSWPALSLQGWDTARIEVVMPARLLCYG